jgi:hypothetical protein
MNTMVANVLIRQATNAERSAQPFKIVALFCSIGLMASLFLATLGVDVTGGIF